jgi:hypothetical protein
VKKEKVYEKGFVIARQGCEKRKVHEKGFVIARQGCEKGPETTISCGLKPHPRRGSH